MPRHRLARDLFVDCILGEGIDAVFGNPGTTELPLMEALAARDAPAYYLGLQEIVCLGMADGYAQATGRPALVNLHASPGLGNAMSNLYNSWRARTPLVVTAGQQDTRFNLQEPLLYSDLVRQASQYCKWAWEIRRADEVPAAVRRAFKEAATPPTGPVFLSLPMDLLAEEVAEEPLPPTRLAPPGLPEPGSLEAAARLLSEAGAPAIVAGDRVDREGAQNELQALAETLGAPVWNEPYSQRLPMAPDHPLFAGFMPTFGPLIKDRLGDADVVLVCGGEAFLMYPPFERGSPFPDGSKVIHLDSSPQEIGKDFPLDLGMVGGLSLTLGALARNTAGEEGPRGERGRAAIERIAGARRSFAAEAATETSDPPSASGLLHTLAPAWRGHIVVDESVSSAAFLQRTLPHSPPAEKYGHRTGGLGWGLPAALGVALARAHGGRRIFCVLGDGAALYAVQGLWTAARYRLDITFVILDNSGYEIIRAGMRRQGGPAGSGGIYPGMTIDDPPVDWGALAAAFGLRYRDLPSVSDGAETLRELSSSPGPALLRALIAPGFEFPS